MEFYELIISLEEKLLTYVPLMEIYDVKKHMNPFCEINGLLEELEKNWNTVIKNFIVIIKELCAYIDKDDYLENMESSINEDIYDLNFVYGDSLHNEFDLREKEKIAKTTLLMHLYACCVFPQGNQKYLLKDGTLDNRGGTKWYYRGESDFNYSLLPSIYRNQDYGINGSILDYSFIFNYYYKRKLISRYNDFKKYEEIDYDFCSLMQHAGCKSPLLDITSDSKIALSFASENNPDKDGSLYVFSNIKESTDTNIRKLNVFAIDSALDYLTKVRGKRILFCGIDDFEIEMEILTKQNNDRMKFQKGAFLYINKCILVNKRILIPVYNKQIKKYLVTSEYKNEYLQDLEKRYKCEYLMNPYLYLSGGI